MSKEKHPTSIAEQEYEDIQAAVMETERGRWFLNEYAQRNRVADTTMLLEAIKKLEGMVAEKETIASSNPDVEKMRFDIVDMANAIAVTKQQIAEIKSSNGDDSRLDGATAELDAIVVAAETATSDILGAAENIQEVAWTMREDGAKEADFDRLDALATDIYMACSFQDITGQRTTKVISVLQFLENRIMAMMNIWGIESSDIDPLIANNAPCTDDDSHLLNGPALDGEGVDQDDIDLLLADEEELFAAVAQPADQMPADEITMSDDDELQEVENIDVAENDIEFAVPASSIDELSQTDKTALFT